MGGDGRIPTCETRAAGPLVGFGEWMRIAEARKSPGRYTILNRGTAQHVVTRQPNPFARIVPSALRSIGSDVTSGLEERGLKPSGTYGLGRNDGDSTPENGVMTATLPLQMPRFFYNGSETQENPNKPDTRRMRPIELMKGDPQKDFLYILYDPSKDKDIRIAKDFTEKLIWLQMIEEMTASGELLKFDMKNYQKKEQIQNNILIVAFMFKPKKETK